MTIHWIAVEQYFTVVLIFLKFYSGVQGLSNVLDGTSYLGSLTNKLDMKSLASSEMTSKLSSSKSHSAAVTLASVSLSSSPSNGDNPLRL